MPAPAPDLTVDDRSQPICPRCRRGRDAFPGYAQPPGTVPRCPEHHLALIAARDLASGDPLLGQSIAGRFIIIGRLGKGSMGSVYRARQEPMGRDVALKIVRRERAHDPETKARFEREARAISQLTSPHTVTAFDFGEAEDGSWFLALEMLEGETLGERIRRSGRLPWQDAVRHVKAALASLEEAHVKVIIHRDLKPDNLFLARGRDADAPEVCKVLDFGIAKWTNEREERPIDALETQAGMVFGTPRYMSPEQAQGHPLDARSDIYSLGVIFYQAVTGRAPFLDDDAVVVMARHIKDAPPPFHEVAPEALVPAPIEEVIHKALAKKPGDRPAGAARFLEEIRAACELAGAAASGPQPAQSERVPASGVRLQRRVFMLSVAFVAIVGVALGLWFFLVPRDTSPAMAPESSARPSKSEVAKMTPSEKLATEPAIIQENSRVSGAVTAPTEDSNVGSAKTPRRVIAPTNSARALERKGNERYGRFD
jgi:serine/threonine protein kinase